MPISQVISVRTAAFPRCNSSSALRRNRKACWAVRSICPNAALSRQVATTSAAAAYWPKPNRSMVEGPENDGSFLLNMLLAATDARHFVADLDETAFQPAASERGHSFTRSHRRGRGEGICHNPGRTSGDPVESDHRHAAPAYSHTDRREGQTTDTGTRRVDSGQRTVAVNPECTTKQGPATPLDQIITQCSSARKTTTVSVSKRS